MSVAVATGLTRRFGDTLAVDSLDLEVRRGEVLALLGHNGAGKTTTVRLFNGVLAPSSGSVGVFGLSPLEHGPAVRARTGVLTESQSLEERLSARDNLRYYAALYGYPEERVERRVQQMLDDFGLGAAADQRVGTFSRGMKQRLALARALQHEPELLFLDEPTAGLDPVAARQVTTMIAGQSREEGRTVVLCTHNLGEAQQVADRVAVLRAGRLVALGSPAELVAALGARSGLRLSVAAERVDAAEQVVTALHRPAAGAANLPAAERPADAPHAAPPLTSTREGDGVLLVNGLSRADVPRLVSALVAADVPVHGVEPLQPTLEDVYFALYGETAGVGS